MKETGYSISCVAKCWICSLLRNSTIPEKMKNILQYYSHLRTTIIPQSMWYGSWGIKLSNVFKYLTQYEVSLRSWVIWPFGSGFKNIFHIFRYGNIQTECKSFNILAT